MFKVGIVGFGRLAHGYYVPALRTLGSAEVTAVVDPLPASRMAAGRSFPGAAIYSDCADLWNRPVDALLVASPPSTHLAILNAALDRRIPVFIEKPFLLYDELKLLDAPHEAYRLIMPNFNRRFWPAYRSLREICASGRLGNLQRAEFILRVDVRPWLSVTSHRVDQGEGGALYDLGSSQLDLIRYILGQNIVRMRAEARSVRWSNDLVGIDAQLESGLSVRCELSHAERNRESIAIFGDTASARIGDPNCAVHVETRQSWKDAIVGWTEDMVALGSRALMRHRSMLRYTIRASLAEFLGALSARRPFSPCYADGVENAICLDAAMRSITRKKSVEVRATGIAEHV